MTSSSLSLGGKRDKNSMEPGQVSPHGDVPLSQELLDGIVSRCVVMVKQLRIGLTPLLHRLDSFSTCWFFFWPTVNRKTSLGLKSSSCDTAPGTFLTHVYTQQRQRHFLGTVLHYY